jgi:hypothetical protein
VPALVRECAKFWLRIMNELKTRGVDDVAVGADRIPNVEQRRFRPSTHLLSSAVFESRPRTQTAMTDLFASLGSPKRC